MARKVTQARLNLADAVGNAAISAHFIATQALDPRAAELHDDQLNALADQMFRAISVIKEFQGKINAVHVKGQRA
ncbi:MAG TPA: hypothetical protein VIY48_22005 [Candidatus Paceibacterota bacterium]